MPKDISEGSWKEYLKKEILEKNLHVEAGRGAIKKLFEETSEKFGIAFNTAKTYYYKDLRPNLEQKETSKTLVEDEIKTSKPKIPSVGEVVPVKVVDITHYGVFVDHNGFKGFIHISEVRHGFTKVGELPELFKVNTTVKARVKKIENDKIHFVTKGLSLEPIIDEVDKKLPDEKKDLLSLYLEKQVRQEYRLTDDYNDIVTYLSGYVGALSPAAKDKLKEVISIYGVFPFSMKMMETTRNFKADLGYILINEIEKKLISEGKDWEVEYRLTSHAIEQGKSRANKSEYELLECIRRSEVYVDLPKYRYLKYNDLYFFPCSKEGSNSYNVLTLLLWEDIKDQVEFIMYKYSQEDPN